MPIDAVSSAARSAGTGTEPRLQRGAVIDARVTAVGSDGMVRLATALGTADVATDVPLEPGQAVRLVVQNMAAGLTLALLTDEAGGDAAARQPVALAAPAPAQAPALLRAVAEVMQRNAPSTTGTSALFANLPGLLKGETTGLPAAAVKPAADILSHALSADAPVTAQAVKAAITGSGVFREARMAQGDTAAPSPAADLKSALIAFRTVLGSVAEALDSLKPALPAQAGAPIAGAPAAPGQGGTAAPLPGQPGAPSSPAGDTASETAVRPVPPPPVPETIRDAGVPPQQAARPAAPGGNAPETPMPAAPVGGPPPAEATTETASTAGPPPARFPQLRAQDAASPQGSEPTAPPEPRALPPAIAAAVANLPEPGRSQLVRLLTRSLSGDAPDGTSVRDVLLKAGVVADTELASRGSDGHQDRSVLGRYAEPGLRAAAGRPGAEASVPRADALPRPEPSSTPTLTGEPGTIETVRVLIRETDQALDRTLLNQYASLPRDAGTPGAPQGQHAQAWVMDVPVLIGREATTAQMRITRDGGGQGSAPGNEPRRWSVDFALDSIALGPVHAHVKLVGDGVGVTLWAERPDTAEALKQSSAQLRRALDDAALAVDDVDFHLGAPSRPAAPKGFLVDTQS
jgi:hypothetical protein